MTNYTNPFNLTSFSGAFDYSNTIMTQVTGFSFGGELLLLTCFIAFYGLTASLGGKRSFPFAILMSSIVAFFEVSAQILNPLYLVVCIVLLAISFFFGGE